MKRILQINDRRRALKQRKRSRLEITMGTIQHCPKCFAVFRKGEHCRFCELSIMPGLRAYQIEALKMIAKDMVLLPLTVRSGKTRTDVIVWPRT